MNKKSRWNTTDIIEQKVDITKGDRLQMTLNLETLKHAVE